jgi:hypothetical protein
MNQTTSSNRFDQRRIIRTRLRAIDPLRDWPALQEVIRHWLQVFRPRLPAQPWCELLLAQEHWHPVMDLRSEVVGLSDDH